MPKGNRSSREPTPLELLNRNHNWRQGSLRRLWANVSIISDPGDRTQAYNLVQNEINRTRAEFERAKQEIING